MSAATAFDLLAPAYDELWTNTPIGRLQRDAFWRCAAHLFRAGDHVLDLGCGTGEDAVILSRRGIRVTATDCSPAMVSAARQRGVNARLLPIEEIGRLSDASDGAISNFGALNCVRDLSALRQPLARLIRPGGSLALCVIGRFCLWETAWYASRGQFRKAVRRWRGESSSSMGLAVFYPRTSEIRNALSPDFELIQTTGVGVFVPPSYVHDLPPAVLAMFSAADRYIAALPGFRALSDHRLLIFRRS